jgi:hypothetical protein
MPHQPAQILSFANPELTNNVSDPEWALVVAAVHHLWRKTRACQLLFGMRVQIRVRIVWTPIIRCKTPAWAVIFCLRSIHRAWTTMLLPEGSLITRQQPGS